MLFDKLAKVMTIARIDSFTIELKKNGNFTVTLEEHSKKIRLSQEIDGIAFFKEGIDYSDIIINRILDNWQKAIERFGIDLKVPLTYAKLKAFL